MVTRQTFNWLRTGGIAVLVSATGWCWAAGRARGMATFFGIPPQLVGVDPREGITLAAFLFPVLVWALGPAVVAIPAATIRPGWVGLLIMPIVGLSLSIIAGFIIGLSIGAPSLGMSLLVAIPLPVVVAIVRTSVYMATHWRWKQTPTLPPRPATRTLGMTGVLMLMLLLPGLAFALAYAGARWDAGSETYHDVLASPPRGAPAGQYIAIVLGDKIVAKQLLPAGRTGDSHDQSRMSSESWILPLTAPVQLNYKYTGRVRAMPEQPGL